MCSEFNLQLARTLNAGLRSKCCTLEMDILHWFCILIGLERTHNQDRRQAMKLEQAIQVYQEYHKMNSGKKYD